MKAMIFAVASIFIVTVQVTPSEAQPYQPSWTSAKLSDSYRSTPARYTRHAHYSRCYARAEIWRGITAPRLAYLGHGSGHRTARPLLRLVAADPNRWRT